MNDKAIKRGEGMMAHSKAGKLSRGGAFKGKSREQVREILFASTPSDDEQYGGAGERFLLDDTFPVRQQLLCELVNTKAEPDSVQWFQKKWEGRIRDERPLDIVVLAENLRYVWRKPRMDLAEHVLNQWLAWRPSDAAFKKYLESDMKPLDAERARDYVPFDCSISCGQLIPDFVSLRAMLIQGVFEHWRYFKFCANPDCAAPYFIAKRKDQTVCDAEVCKAEKQREHALKWWNDNRAKKDEGSQPANSGRKKRKKR
jgi:hypothetical protein